MTVTDDFRAARDQLLALRQDYPQAKASFEWPRPEEFNFALDWFDPIAADPASQLTSAEAAELRRGGVSPTTNAASYDRVRAATGARFASMLAKALSTAEAAARLDVDASRIRQLLAERRLLGIRDGAEWRLLDVQFRDRGLVPNIGQVIAALPDGLPPFVAASWLGTPESDLEIDDEAVSPIEWLSAGGDPERVAQLAHDL